MTPKAPASPLGAGVTVAELAERVGGRVEGDGGLLLTGVAAIEEAGPAQAAFIDGPGRAARAAASAAGAVMLPEGIALPGRTLIRVKNPRLANAKALELFHPTERPAAGVHPTAVVAPDADVHPTATVGAFCHVAAGARIGARSVLHPFCHVGEHAVVGEDVLLHPRVSVCDHVRLGDRVIAQCGAVLGSDGFGYVFDGSRHYRVPQVGTVEIGDDAEIGAGTTIDRATTGVTRIGRGTKIDNLVQIGHNVHVGEHCIIVSQVGIAGSSTVGNGVLIGGQSGIAPGSVIGDGAMVAAGTGIMKKVDAGTVVAGIGPLLHGDWLRCQAVYDKLPQLRRQLASLEKRLAAAERAPGTTTA